MDKVASNSQRADIVKEVKKLQPETFFKSTPYIKNADMINYESALRQTMERWIADSSCKDLIDGVISALSGSIDRQVKVMETSHIDISPYTRDEYQKSLLPLLNQLNDADKLPALVFHYDRNGIERIAQELVTALETAENKWKAGNADWQSKVEQWRKWKNDAKTRQKREDAKLKSAKSKSLQENAREGAEGSWLDTFDPDKPLPQFSFQSPRSKVAGQELEDDIAALTRWNDIPDFVASGLRRGIGIHHSGCNRKLRSLIETLFRAGTLRVVIATGMSALLLLTIRDVGAGNQYALSYGDFRW
jgi:superfamily II RNA helicase